MALSNPHLTELAAEFGIATEFWDWKGRHTDISDETVIAVLAAMEIDAQTYQVRADGKLLTCEPAVSLPLAQRYFLF